MSTLNVDDSVRKHSSGDLHSRLKTRKLLGVGETDDGDIHRSKLSQILGHSDQLYIRLPYGLRIWQLFMAIMFTVIGLWALILPSHFIQTTLETDNDHMVSLPIRLYGGAIISLSIVYWMTLNSQDRDIIRMCLLSSIIYFTIQFVVASAHWLFSSLSFTRNTLMLASFHGINVFINWFYHWALMQRKFHTIRRSTSSKDINKEK
uniref:Tumor protein p53-inducible protein 11 n=1 Tax=Arion vulgaris TaxID=1028688 RepID=A0A0B7B6F0_9EUPU